MVAAIPDPWSRPHFQPDGGNPLLYYAVFGRFDLSQPLSRSRYRTSGLPDWLEMVQCNRDEQPDVFARYHAGSIWEVLRRDVPVTAREAEAALQCVVLRGEPEDPPTLEYFRDAIGVVTWLLDAGGCAVYDPQMLWLWSADEWREDVFEPDKPYPDRHTAILVAEDAGGTSWFHTRGMRKYGRPDLSVRGVGSWHAEGVTVLIERFVEYQALGGVISDGQEVRSEDLPPGGVCRHGGNVDDPDFNNAHVEIVWPGSGLK